MKNLNLRELIFTFLLFTFNDALVTVDALVGLVLSFKEKKSIGLFFVIVLNGGWVGLGSHHFSLWLPHQIKVMLVILNLIPLGVVFSELG